MFREHEQPLLLLLPLPPLPLRPQLPFLPILSIIVLCTTIQRLYGNVPSLEKKRRRCRFLSCPWSPSVQSTFLRKHFWKHIWSFIPLKKKKLLFVLQPSRSFNISEWMMVIGRHQDVLKIQIWKHSVSCRNHIKHELGKKWTVIKKSFFCFYQRTKTKAGCRRLLPKIFSFPRKWIETWADMEPCASLMKQCFKQNCEVPLFATYDPSEHNSRWHRLSWTKTVVLSLIKTIFVR